MIKWLVVLVLLLLTLGWKFAVQPGVSGGLTEKAVQQNVAEFLERGGFAVAATETITDGQPMVRAVSAACRVLVARSNAMGWDSDLIRRHATPEDRVFVVFRGKIYAKQPTWLTMLDFLWARFRREIGLDAQATPVLTVIATAPCEGNPLPWQEMASTL